MSEHKDGQIHLEDIVDLERRGYRATAITYLQEYLATHPGSADGWYYLARYSQKPRRQLKAVRRALRLDPKHEGALEFHEALLEEYPWLSSRIFTREARILLIGLILLTLISLGIVLAWPWLVSEEPQVIIIEQPSITETGQTANPTLTPLVILAPSAETTSDPVAGFTMTPLVPSLTPPPIAASPLPSSTIAAPTITATPIALPEFPAESARLVLVSPFQDDTGSTAERLSAELASLFTGGDLRFAVAQGIVRNSEQAAAVAGDSDAALIIYGTMAADGQIDLHLFVLEDSNEVRGHPQLRHLVRPTSPWEVTLRLKGPDISLDPVVQGIIAYITYRHYSVVSTLNPLFTDLNQPLDENGQRLLLLLAYSQQALGNSRTALQLYDLLNTYNAEIDPGMNVNRAFAVAIADNPEAGIALYRSLLPTYFDPAFIHTNIGVIYGTMMGDISGANAALEQAMQLDPVSARPHIEKAWLMVAQNDTGGALRELDTAESIDAAYVPVYVERARLYVRLGQYDNALEDINRAITLAPLLGSSYALQGHILVQLRRWQDAVISLERVVLFDVPTSEVYADLAAAYLALGDADAALRRSNNALAMDGESPAAWLQHGRARMAQGNYEDARNDFSEGLERDTDNVDLLVGRCTANAHLGDDGAAIKDCDQALSIDPQNGFALEQRGLIRERSGDWAGAADDFAEAVAYEPDAYYAHYFLGLYALQDARYEEAVGHLSTTISLAPTLAEAYAARGVVYRIMQQWQQAMVDLEQAIALNPADYYSYYELGVVKAGMADIAFEGGNRERALALYEEAVSAYSVFIQNAEPDNTYLEAARAGQAYAQQALIVVTGQN